MLPIDEPLLLYFLPNKTLMLENGQIFNESIELLTGRSKRMNI